jgi:hypothetical protein
MGKGRRGRRRERVIERRAGGRLSCVDNDILVQLADNRKPVLK